MEQDFYPQAPVMDVESLDNIDFYKNKILDSLVRECRVEPFKVYNVHGQIYTKSIPLDRPNIERYFRYQVKGAHRVEPFLPDNIYWEKVELRLIGKEGHKNSNDVRTCFRIDLHKFVVPCLFTFGQRQVPFGYVHLLETTASPMCVYRLTPESLQNYERPIVLKESSFTPRDETWYDRFILQPYTRYQFEAGTVYTFITARKTLFSLHVFTNPKNEKYGENPFVNRKLLVDPFKQSPIPTPSTSNTSFTLPRKRIRVENPPVEIVAIPSAKVNVSTSTDLLWTQNTIVKLCKGPYDYPHPIMEYMKLDEYLKAFKPSSMQCKPIDLSIPKKSLLDNVLNEEENITPLTDEQYLEIIKDLEF